MATYSELQKQVEEQAAQIEALNERIRELTEANISGQYDAQMQAMLVEIRDERDKLASEVFNLSNRLEILDDYNSWLETLGIKSRWEFNALVRRFTDPRFWYAAGLVMPTPPLKEDVNLPTMFIEQAIAKESMDGKAVEFHDFYIDLLNIEKQNVELKAQIEALEQEKARQRAKINELYMYITSRQPEPQNEAIRLAEIIELILDMEKNAYWTHAQRNGARIIIQELTKRLSHALRDNSGAPTKPRVFTESPGNVDEPPF